MLRNIKQFNYLMLALIAVNLFSSCKEEEQEINKQIEKGTIRFSFDKRSVENSRLSQGHKEPIPRSVIISIKDSEGDYILNAKKLSLVKLGEGYFTENVEFAEGQYSIDDFLVLDSIDATIYLTPKLGSKFENLVDTPLPFSFEINSQKTTQVNLEVVPSDLGDPIKYGYGVFSFSVVNTLERGLILHLPFNGNANDVSSKGNHGVVNGATLTSDRNGVENSAYFFDGVDDKIDFGYDEHFSNLSVTFSYWVNFKEFHSAVVGNDIIDNRQSGAWFSIGQTEKTFNQISFSYGNGGGPMPSSRKTFGAKEYLKADQWYHIVGIIDGQDSIGIFINGVKAEGTYTGSATTYNHSEGEGSVGRVWDPGSFFSGKIDDLRIYNRALTEAEIKALYSK